jgi:hypothetical protein
MTIAEALTAPLETAKAASALPGSSGGQDPAVAALMVAQPDLWTQRPDKRCGPGNHRGHKVRS